MTEVPARAVRAILEHEHVSANQSAACMAIAPQVGWATDTLRRWVKQSDIDSDFKDRQTSDERSDQGDGARDTRPAPSKCDSQKSVSIICAGTARLPLQKMIAFIKEHREDLGVEPVCKVLPIAQSIFYAHVAIARNPDLASDRAKRDVDLSREIKRVWEQNNKVYGTRKVWHQLQREKFTIARCTVAELMEHLAIQGVIRGKVKKTTVPDKGQPRPKDKGNRKVRAPAPNMLWVSDFTRVSIWQGVVYVAFIIDTFADKIVG